MDGVLEGSVADESPFEDSCVASKVQSPQKIREHPHRSVLEREGSVNSQAQRLLPPPPTIPRASPPANSWAHEPELRLLCPSPPLPPRSSRSHPKFPSLVSRLPPSQN